MSSGYDKYGERIAVSMINLHCNPKLLSASQTAKMVNKAVRVTKVNGAIVETQTKPFSASDLDANEVLIKNVAVASNPKDWKLAKWGMFEGIEGNDVAGHIEAVGADVKDLKKGDKVSLTQALHMLVRP